MNSNEYSVNASRVAVFGSCVSMQSLHNLGVRPHHLAANILRGSFAGLIPTMPSCNPIDPARILDETIHPKIQAWLSAELSKQVPALLSFHKPELLIIDLFEERFDLLVTRDGLVINESWELISSGWSALPELVSARRIERLSDEAWSLWDAGLLRFRQWMERQNHVPFRILLVRASWAAEYVTPVGLVPFSETVHLMPGKEVLRRPHAEHLERCQTRFLEHFPQAMVIEPPGNTQMADPDHIWGLSPFHYVPAFYDYVASQLKDIITASAEGSAFVR